MQKCKSRWGTLIKNKKIRNTYNSNLRTKLCSREQ